MESTNSFEWPHDFDCAEHDVCFLLADLDSEIASRGQRDHNTGAAGEVGSIRDVDIPGLIEVVDRRNSSEGSLGRDQWRSVGDDAGGEMATRRRMSNSPQCRKEWISESQAGDARREQKRKGIVVAARNNSECEDEQKPLEWERLVQSLAVFSLHTPRCVMSDITASMQVEECGDTEIENAETKLAGQVKASQGLRRHSGSSDLSTNSEKKKIFRALRRESASSNLSVNMDLNDQLLQTNPSTESRSVNMRKNPKNQTIKHQMLTMPHSTQRESALLLVDVTGFTKLSTILDVEDLSMAINSYFELIIHELLTFGADILKFAGDAIFAEWAASSRGMTLVECVIEAEACSAAILKVCSDFKIKVSVKSENRFLSENRAMLNVHCGLGVGQLVGLHVGDIGDHDAKNSLNRHREFLFLGDPVDQVSVAANKAKDGQLAVSPQAMQLLETAYQLPKDARTTDGPSVISSRSYRLLSRCKWKLPGERSRSFRFSVSRLSVYESLRKLLTDMDEDSLHCLWHQLSLYSHPLVRLDENERSHNIQGLTQSFRFHARSQKRHRAEAELRSCYVMFLAPQISTEIRGPVEANSGLFNTLNDIVNVTSRELNRFNGHIRQFIVDDKGCVLIATFGLRGSTFPNMVPKNALPATMSIHYALKHELNIDSRIGATYGKVYCGIVGGLRRHEFAVMGAPVNLAARLMCSSQNSSILVDEAVQKQASGTYLLHKLTEVEAKGYSKPVAIFEPQCPLSKRKIGDATVYVKRREQSNAILKILGDVMSKTSQPSSQIIFLSGGKGVGKTAFTLNFIKEIHEFCDLSSTRSIVSRSTCKKNEQSIPFSALRGSFLRAMKASCVVDGTILSKSQNTAGISQRSLNSVLSQQTFSSRNSAYQSPSRKIIYRQKLYSVSERLSYGHEFVDSILDLLGFDVGDEDWRKLDAGAQAISTFKMDRKSQSARAMVGFLGDVFTCLTDFAHLSVIVLDDSQWCDSLSWQIIRALIGKGKKLLIVCSLRSNDKYAARRISWIKSSRYKIKPTCTELSLGPLSKLQVKDLIAKSLGYDTTLLDDDFCAEIHKRTHGMPVFAVEFLESIKGMEGIVDMRRESGLIGWKSSEAKNFLSETSANRCFEELFFQRFDTLDFTVRKIICTGAILGMEFTSHDIQSVHKNLRSIDIEKALETAVREFILHTDDEEEDDDEMSFVTDVDQYPRENSTGELCPVLLAWRPSESRSFQFNNIMWRDLVLKSMLSERRKELHRLVAEAIEEVTETVNATLMLKLFHHWNKAMDFSKAAPLALAIGRRCEDWDDMRQSLHIYRKALSMLRPTSREMGRKMGFDPSVLTSSLDAVMKLLLRIGDVSFRMGDEKQSAFAYTSAYKALMNSESGSISRQTVLLTVSGLSFALSLGLVPDDKNLTRGHTMVATYIYEFRFSDNPIHQCRALSIEASLFSRVGKLEKALDAQGMLESIYSFDGHSAAICREYGRDFAAQSCCDSVQWHYLLGDQTKANDQIEFFRKKILIKLDPRNVEAAMALVLPIALTAKALGKAKAGERIFDTFVGDRVLQFGDSSNVWLTLFYPTLYMLRLARMDEQRVENPETEDMIESWALQWDVKNFCRSFERHGRMLVGEICWRLARRKKNDNEKKNALLMKGTALLSGVVKGAKERPGNRFIVEQAKCTLEGLSKLAQGDVISRRQSDIGINSVKQPTSLVHDRRASLPG